MSIMAIGRIFKTGGCFYYRVEKRRFVGGVVHPSQCEKVILSPQKVVGGGWGGGGFESNDPPQPNHPTYGPEHIYELWHQEKQVLR